MADGNGDDHFARHYTLASAPGQLRYKVRYYKVGDRFFVAIKDMHNDAIVSRIALDRPHSDEVSAIIEELKHGPVAEVPIATRGRVRIQSPLVSAPPVVAVVAAAPVVLQSAESPPRRKTPNPLQRYMPSPGANVSLGKGSFGEAVRYDTGFEQVVHKYGKISKFEKYVLPYLNHPNIVDAHASILGKEHTDKYGKPMMTMKAAPGITFLAYKRMSSRPSLGESDWNHWKSQWLSVTEYMRGFQIHHNDLGVKNVLIVPETLDFTIIDWGGGSVEQPFGPSHITITLKQAAVAVRWDWAFINYYFMFMALVTNQIPVADRGWIKEYTSLLDTASERAFIYPAGEYKELGQSFYRTRDEIMAYFAALSPQKKEVMLKFTYMAKGWLYKSDAPAPVVAPAVVISSSSSSGLFQQRLQQMAQAPVAPSVYVDGFAFAIDSFTNLGELQDRVRSRIGNRLPANGRWNLITESGQVLLAPNATLQSMGVHAGTKMRIMPVM
jgi:serine/threonine protein kinase